MTTSAQLRDLAVTALKGATAAGQNVFTIRDWPTEAEDYPILMVKTPKESRESLGRNAPQFTTTLTVAIIARVRVPTLPNDAGALQAEQQLETIKRQIELALINNPALTRLIQQFPFIETDMDVNSDGDQPLGQLVMQVGMEFYEGPEDFYPIDGMPVNEVGINIDLTNVYDPTGTYANPPFPAAVNPAPRTSGPDGRDEGDMTITFT